MTMWVTTFITGPNHNGQNSKMLYDLITNSVSMEALQQVQLWHTQYEINRLISGKCFLKVII